MSEDLFTPLELRETRVPNRVMVSPMCQYSCEDRDGLATDWHLVHLGSRAAGGAGIVMTEATAVESRGRISPQDLGIWSDEHGEALAPVAEFIKGQDSVPAIQLAHAGRKASKTRPWDGSEPLQPDESGWETIAPSAAPWPYDEGRTATAEMTQTDIEDVIDSFAAAAERAHEAGFEIAEVHAAHGYLLHEFLSPVTNHREDDFGGSFEDRTRIVREATAAVREVWPDNKPVFVRISATDWLPDRDAWTVEQSVQLADDLSTVGADLIDVSAGGLHPDQELPSAGPSYQVPYAQEIRKENDSEVAVGAVGGITSPEQADAIVRNGRADLAILGREHLRDPYFTLHAAETLDRPEAAEPPLQYRRGF
ncbi:NADH:flavin oxidoreductase/NADH oxidase [Halococcus saccharolyticus]|uniref:NADH-dependent flavin oxidoreductase n=1 Tax=Halococcus saccharolyticus DSM 5350 TaxID=1227455 RepID=M0MKS9_9EURY|nr:NADH:flavin oxidoreductase/NADH oxidase [Halococcus saccharolyticus]EMA45020.1 NADH-dependent flavin oxidoreductase [Halococcus saccharolyticus DSM 5350]